MRSNIQHLVVTTSDCIALGGHFYSSVAYHDTLKGMIAEHFLGGIITNASHTMSPLILCQAMVALTAAVTGDEAVDPRNKKALVGHGGDCNLLNILRFEFLAKVLFFRETAFIF